MTDAAHELGGLYALRAGVNGALQRLGDEGMRAQSPPSPPLLPFLRDFRAMAAHSRAARLVVTKGVIAKDITSDTLSRNALFSCVGRLARRSEGPERQVPRGMKSHGQ